MNRRKFLAATIVAVPAAAMAHATARAADPRTLWMQLAFPRIGSGPIDPESRVMMFDVWPEGFEFEDDGGRLEASAASREKLLRLIGSPPDVEVCEFHWHWGLLAGRGLPEWCIHRWRGTQHARLKLSRDGRHTVYWADPMAGV